MEVAKGLLKNFIDIDDVISPKGRQPFYVPPEVAKPKPAPGFSLPHPDVTARNGPPGAIPSRLAMPCGRWLTSTM